MIFGDPDHPEVKGVLGWCRGRGWVVKDETLEDLPDYLPSKIGVISQTTHTPERFASFVSNLMTARIDQLTEIRVINVLCNATTSQQAATRELAEEVDMMIVVGGYNSANTRHLAELSAANGIVTHPLRNGDRAGGLVVRRPRDRGGDGRSFDAGFLDRRCGHADRRDRPRTERCPGLNSPIGSLVGSIDRGPMAKPGGSGEIAFVEEDSLAEKVGLAPGDRVVGANGRPIRDQIDYRFLVADEVVGVRDRG